MVSQQALLPLSFSFPHKISLFKHNIDNTCFILIEMMKKALWGERVNVFIVISQCLGVLKLHQTSMKQCSGSDGSRPFSMVAWAPKKFSAHNIVPSL